MGGDIRLTRDDADALGKLQTDVLTMSDADLGKAMGGLT